MCKIVGIFLVKIQTFDGVFYTLDEVRHVPLMMKGYSFKGKGGAMYVYKGFEVILKGIKRGTLFSYQVLQ